MSLFHSVIFLLQVEYNSMYYLFYLEQSQQYQSLAGIFDAIMIKVWLL